MINLLIKDETATGKLISQLNLLIKGEMLTVRELITQRVNFEVSEYNKNQTEYFNGLVQPTDSEKDLNSYKMKEKKLINAEKQVEKALSAFEANGFFIIANDRQLESLDEHILVDDTLTLSFIKLVPLIGG